MKLAFLPLLGACAIFAGCASEEPSATAEAPAAADASAPIDSEKLSSYAGLDEPTRKEIDRIIVKRDEQAQATAAAAVDKAMRDAGIEKYFIVLSNDAARATKAKALLEEEATIRGAAAAWKKTEGDRRATLAKIQQDTLDAKVAFTKAKAEEVLASNKLHETLAAQAAVDVELEVRKRELAKYNAIRESIGQANADITAVKAINP